MENNESQAAFVSTPQLAELPCYALLEKLASAAPMAELLGGIAAGKKYLHGYGLQAGALPLLASLVGVNRQGTVLVVVPKMTDAIDLSSVIGQFMPEHELVIYPAMDVMPYDVMATNTDVQVSRVDVLAKLIANERCLILAPVRSLLNALPPAQVFREMVYPLAVGDELEIGRFAAHLVSLGYERVRQVEAEGQFAQRGGIVDIFIPGQSDPFRLDFFGDEIESISYFNVVGQCSTTPVARIKILPAAEYVPDKDALLRTSTSINRSLTKSKLKPGKHLANFLEKIEHWAEHQMPHPNEIAGFLPMMLDQTAGLMEYLPQDALVIFHELRHCQDEYQRSQTEMQGVVKDLLPQGETLAEHAGLYLPWEKHLDENNPGTFLVAETLLRTTIGWRPQVVAGFAMLPPVSFFNAAEVFKAFSVEQRAKGHQLICTAASAPRVERIQSLFEKAGLGSTDASIASCGLLQGFVFPGADVAVVTDSELFSLPRRVARMPRMSRGQGLRIFTEVSPGDHVVHQTHGIGVFDGIVNLKADGVNRDYLCVRFAGEDKVYVPTDQVGVLQRYVGGSDGEPKLSHLGREQWNKLKQKAKESVMQMAEELMGIYALRAAEEGYAFAPDTIWQAEFEENFPYEETPDQLRAIEEIKKDMETAKPMDRLLCGDVGYGKTEVAMRAIFKAVNDGRQAAVLVPTTVLASQHHTTFQERFADFPVNIGLLSRFCTGKEVAATLQAMAQGEIDLVIGTHRLLQKDVAFKNLGLLVVDEEQRFGVKDKEKIKRLRHNVDVLTLTATPIPRTLYMSLTGMRDISTIALPPENRIPVQTFVLEHNWEIVRDAIHRELSRGGQVYYVCNRISALTRIEQTLRRILPGVTAVIAHGQMPEHELEDAMLGFSGGEFQVLLATTIIENGLDISNVNTLIVQDADRLGLAQLYQLRGRVGRSDRQAYAYFTFPLGKALPDAADKRLAAIREFTEFGSGFKLAMRDLEIRGAGNILGAEQHGYIAAVGYDLYCRMLEEAIAELQGKVKTLEPESFVEFKADAYIPESYVDDAGLRLDIYKRLAETREPEQVTALGEELLDRFGHLPEAVRGLLAALQAKLWAQRCLVAEVKDNAGNYRIRFHQGRKLSREEERLLLSNFPGRLMIEPGKILRITFMAAGRLPAERAESLAEFLACLAQKTV